jgi:hypothetical protein
MVVAVAAVAVAAVVVAAVAVTAVAVAVAAVIVTVTAVVVAVTAVTVAASPTTLLRIRDRHVPVLVRAVVGVATATAITSAAVVMVMVVVAVAVVVRSVGTVAAACRLGFHNFAIVVIHTNATTGAWEHAHATSAVGEHLQSCRREMVSNLEKSAIWHGNRPT